MKIFCNMMVKNEEMFIKYSLISVAPVVEKIIIIDNMSEDNTIKIIEETKNKINIPIVIEQNDTRDLAEMRNQALEMSDCDWIVIIDGDEVYYNTGKNNIQKSILAVQHLEKEEAYEPKVVSLPFYHFYGSFSHLLARIPLPSIRLLKADGSVKWGYPRPNLLVHEEPQYEKTPEKENAFTSDTAFAHYGYCKPSKVIYNKGVDYLERGHFNTIPEKDPNNPLAGTEVIKFDEMHPSAMASFPFFKYQSEIEKKDGKLFIKNVGW